MGQHSSSDQTANDAVFSAAVTKSATAAVPMQWQQAGGAGELT